MPYLEVFVIADGRSALAFALAGVRGGVVEGKAAARELLAQARADAGVGLILITERLAAEIRQEVDGARRESVRPLILEIPDLEGPLTQKESLLDRLRVLMGIPG
jgi:V/A-type H+-transporting ATPase subunit F